MKYRVSEIKLFELIEKIENDNLDLSPSYQRNFIWSKADQVSLIESILKGYPLPNIFILEKDNGMMEMIDGQQRSRTIYRFYKSLFQVSKNISYQNCDKESFLNYRLPVVYVYDVHEIDNLNDFYVLINKKGKALNKAEVDKAEYSDNTFLKLAEEALEYQPLIDLNIFTEATTKRMNDRLFIQELLAYLLYGITDKKSGIEQAYADDEHIKKQYSSVLKSFKKIIDEISVFNKFEDFSKTRFRQKNDFFSIFTFFNEHPTKSTELREYQVQILLILNRKDKYGEQFISPSNDKCEVLREYALNCVSQSNSKKARQTRLNILANLLANKSEDLNDSMESLLDYFEGLFGSENIDIANINGYFLIDINTFQ